MTVSSAIEMKIRGRAGCSAPADAAGKLLGVRSAGEKESKRFSVLVHWAYGTGWGAACGVLAALGLPAPAATAAHLALVWGTGQVMLPALRVAPPATRWGEGTGRRRLAPPGLRGRHRHRVRTARPRQLKTPGHGCRLVGICPLPGCRGSGSPSILTPFQNATWPLILRASGLGCG